MTVVRIDTHAHLYDSYPVRTWCEGAIRNLKGDSNDRALVVVVDRLGQSSLDRLRREVPAFGRWRDGADGQFGVVECESGSLIVVRGVQYVAHERIEVLGLGVSRALDDGLPATRYIESIRSLGGVPCLPWSPGKWLGGRGRVVKGLLDTHSPESLTVGDISIRSTLGPPSSLLGYARRRGYRVLCGTDPLPSARDAGLVGSFGVELSGQSFAEETLGVKATLAALMSTPMPLSKIGRRNSPVAAVSRFVGQSLGL